jgi:hypothetical protein
MPQTQMGAAKYCEMQISLKSRNIAASQRFSSFTNRCRVPIELRPITKDQFAMTRGNTKVQSRVFSEIVRIDTPHERNVMPPKGSFEGLSLSIYIGEVLNHEAHHGSNPP